MSFRETPGKHLRAIALFTFLTIVPVSPVMYGRAAEESRAAAVPAIPDEALVIRAVGRPMRSGFFADPVAAQVLGGTWAAPKNGEQVPLPGGAATWEKAAVGKDGILTHDGLAGGYAYFAVRALARRVMVLEASGHLMVYVNGEPRVGDVYGKGYVRVPVLLHAGTNDLLFHVGGRNPAGRLRARLRPVVDNYDIDPLAEASSRALDAAYHYGQSKPGTFGWEANRGSVRAFLQVFRDGNSELEALSDAVHRGWGDVARTYDDPVYQTKPEKKANRLKLADTPYRSLPEDEKEKDRVVARALLQAIRGDPPSVRGVAADALLNPADMLLPDLIAGDDGAVWGAVVVLNVTERPLTGLALRTRCAGADAVTTPLPPLPPLSLRKYGCRFRGPAGAVSGTCDAEVALLAGGAREVDTARVRLAVRHPDESHKRTFLSDIDGSVQYYALNPARPVARGGPAPALFLTLHGADVEATGQAAAYEAKTWGHLVAPTNRRPYGFDWEDWGRIDALEVLHRAKELLHTDPQRTYLTGHSMGGHGVWHLGVTYPAEFAAIGPSAGWISFWTYVHGPRPEAADPVDALLHRATSPTDTLSLAHNTAQEGVYILHGEKDDNVPVGQARAMQQLLAGFHHDFVYHEQPGAGHWWDASPEPGTDCVDWAPMFDFFARHVIPRPDAVRQVDFTTASPGVSARCFWATVEAQQEGLKLSTVHVRSDPGLRRFTGTTENVARLSLDVGQLQPGRPVGVELDGQKIDAVAWPEQGTRVWLERKARKWSALRAEPPPSLKGPERCGPFRSVFGNHVQFVYGTKGTAAENAAAFARARYDAETFWYRGNASVEVVPDTAFEPAKERDRNVVLYGNADTNGAWQALLGDSPVQVLRGAITVGDRREKGDDLGCLLIRPRPGSDRAGVGAVAGTGVAGLRLTEVLPYFSSGVAYPDWLVVGPEVLTEGGAGVRGTGYFGVDWGLDVGQTAWRK